MNIASVARLISGIMSFLNSLLHLTNYNSPFLRTLVPSIGLAYGLQAAVAIPSILAQTERYYDLSGSFTYISCTALSLYLPTLRARAAASAAGGAVPQWPSLLASLSSKGAVNAWNWRQVVLSAAVSIWATRRKLHSLCHAEHRLTITSSQSARSSSRASPPTKAATPASTASAPPPPDS